MSYHFYFILYFSLATKKSTTHFFFLFGFNVPPIKILSLITHSNSLTDFQSVNHTSFNTASWHRDVNLS